MSLVEVARFVDVYEAELARAFLASRGIEVSLTERFQTTVDPLMQRALGIRLMGLADQAEAARDLLARAHAGEFATADGDDIKTADPRTRAIGRVLALIAFAGGGFWGAALPRRFRPVQWHGLLFAAIAVFGVILVSASIGRLLLDPP